MSGICLIALGLFLGASLYSDAVGLVGKAISAFFFGIFGLGGYAVPAAVVAFGVLLIIFSENAMRPAAVFLVVLGTLSILTLLHIHARSAIAVSYTHLKNSLQTTSWKTLTARHLLRLPKWGALSA